MKVFKWPLVFLPVILFFGCVSTFQGEVRLTVDSEPPNAKIYEEGKFLGNAPVTLTYKYGTYGVANIHADLNGSIEALLKPRSFRVMKDGFEPQTKSFQFYSHQQNNLTDAPGINWEGRPEFFPNPNFSLNFLLEPQGAKPQQQQQQQQQQQTVVIMPNAVGGAKTYGTLTIITTPAQAEVYVDGTFVSTTPVSNLQIEAGPHKIEIQKNGYKTWSRTMQVLANSPVKIEVELEKI